tara:strand:+ start:1651 stop:1794 length:144 start_codon:yes stop_codon:yes gene_type:complete
MDVIFFNLNVRVGIINMHIMSGVKYWFRLKNNRNDKNNMQNDYIIFV